LQFAKACSAATLLRHLKNNTEALQRGRVNLTGFMWAVASQSSRRCTFGEFESMAVASRRQQRMFQQLFHGGNFHFFLQKFEKRTGGGPAGTTTHHALETRFFF
jgi:hypothetical protein